MSAAKRTAFLDVMFMMSCFMVLSKTAGCMALLIRNSVVLLKTHHFSISKIERVGRQKFELFKATYFALILTSLLVGRVSSGK